MFSDSQRYQIGRDWKASNISSKINILLAGLVFIGLVPVSLLSWLTESSPHIFMTYIYILFFTILSIYYFDKIGIVLVAFSITFPPYIEYELAHKAIIAYKKLNVISIREDVTATIFSFIEVVFFISLISILSKRKKPLPKLYVYWCSCFLLTLFVSFVVNLDIKNHYLSNALISGLISYVKIPIIMAAIYKTMQDADDLKTMLFSVSLAAPIMLLQNVYVTLAKNAGNVAIGKSQMTGVIPGPGPTASYLLMLFPILISYSFLTKSRFYKSIILALSLTSIIFILLSYTRSAYIGLIFTVIMLCTGLYRKKRLLLSFISIGLLMVIMFFILNIAEINLKNKFTATLYGDIDDTINLGVRMTYWEHALSLIKRHPIFGIGPNMWGLTTAVGGTNVHNGYINIILDIGVIGLIIFLIPIIKSFFSFFNNIKLSKTYRNIAICIMSGVLGYLITQFFSCSIMNVRVMVLLWTSLTIQNILPKLNKLR